MDQPVFRISAETRPLYGVDTARHLCALPDLDLQSRRGGFAIHLGYRYDLEEPAGTKDIFVAQFGYQGIIFGSTLELAPEIQPRVAMAMAALIGDGWVDDFMCLVLPDEKGPLALGEDSCAICMPNVLIVEAGLWPVYRGDDDAYQYQLDRQVRVIIASGLSAHAHIEAVRLARTYIIEKADTEANVDSSLLQSTLLPGKRGFDLHFY